MKDQNGSKSVDKDDLVVDGETVGPVVPFHKKLMQDALREDSGVSSAARLAAKIRSQEREAERSRGTTGDSRNGKKLRLPPLPLPFDSAIHWSLASLFMAIAYYFTS